MRRLLNANAKFALTTMAAGLILSAQEPNPTQKQPTRTLRVEAGTPAPLYHVDVVERTTPAVNYLHRSGTSKIDFGGTPLMASGKGSAKVESQRGVIQVSAEFEKMAPPSSFGPEYLTYVLWAISPDGRPVNLGELTLNDHGNGSRSKIEATSDIQTFGMIVTAEPYYAVTQPSDVVVLENIARTDTRGIVEAINAKYELLPRGAYTKTAGFVPLKVGKKDPLELYEAENALELARLAGADKYSPDSFQQATGVLRQARIDQSKHPGQKSVITMAREVVVRAEDARVIALRRQKEEAAENERLAAIARENAQKRDAEAARVKAEDEARLRAAADADRIAAEKAKADAERAKQEAVTAAIASDRLKREAEEARQAALAQQEKLASEASQARAAAEDAERLRQDAERERQKAEANQAQLRQQLLAQFNAILQTRDTARGLIVNISDVLFDTGKYSLKPGAREKLAKVSGILLGHPGLKIAVEGHTDNVGSDEYNLKLSQERANSVRAYLVSQSLDPAAVTATGFGETTPVADNGTAAGRQRNRRVELVISGEILGTTIDVQTSSVAVPRK